MKWFNEWTKANRKAFAAIVLVSAVLFCIIGLFTDTYFLIFMGVIGILFIAMLNSSASKYDKSNDEKQKQQSSNNVIFQAQLPARTITIQDDTTGKPLKKLVSDYVVIDIETTGLKEGSDTIIELAAIRVRNGVISDTFSRLVKPPFLVCDRIRDLTGISNSMLMNEATLEVIFPSFIEFIGKDVLIGHNVNFDMRFLNLTQAEQTGFYLHNDFVDTLPLARKTFDFSDYKLDTLARELNISAPEHRALADCYATYELYEKIKKATQAA